MRRRRRERRVAILAVLTAMALAALGFGNDACIAVESDAPSRAIGTPSDGRLEQGKRLPTRGENFRAYSLLGALLGRNSVHHAVRDATLAAYEDLATSHPDVVHVFGETSWPRGGPFPPHKTHQNGLSVDFMVPVRDGKGESIPLPRGPFRKFGYALEFDDEGRLGDLRIDFDAMAAHLLALDARSAEHELRIDRVIFDPELQPLLFEADGGPQLRRSLTFSTKRSWVRHDEHYHVDFELNGG